MLFGVDGQDAKSRGVIAEEEAAYPSLRSGQEAAPTERWSQDAQDTEGFLAALEMTGFVVGIQAVLSEKRDFSVRSE